MNISYISRLYELFDEFAETEYVLGIMGIPNTNYPSASAEPDPQNRDVCNLRVPMERWLA